ncbi:MAG: XrtA/PEP-CTERM system exopolysaccharide export protein [Pseudomonadota bacterium]
MNAPRQFRYAAAAFFATLLLTGCTLPGFMTRAPNYLPQPAAGPEDYSVTPSYVIGPLDNLDVFVWRSDELSTEVIVRPDGRISTPLIDDMVAAGKTPAQLSQNIEDALSRYVKDPEVTVLVKDFSSTFDQQVRVLGAAQDPQAFSHRAGMTVLDVMVAVGGLTDFAAGNRAVLIRGRGSDRKTYSLRLDDMLRRGDIRTNAPVFPGDVIVVPERRF